MPHPSERDRTRPDWRTHLQAYERAWQQAQERPTPANLALLRLGAELLYRQLQRPGRFPLGQTVMTPGADEAMTGAGHIPPEFLLRHVHGEWGELDEFDRRQNERALLDGSRLLSACDTRRGERLWVITESNRSVTTLLLPSEY